MALQRCVDKFLEYGVTFCTLCPTKEDIAVAEKAYAEGIALVNRARAAPDGSVEQKIAAAAAEAAGRMRESGRYYVLLPKNTKPY